MFDCSQTLELHILGVHKAEEEERELNTELNIEDEEMTDDVINDSADFHKDCHQIESGAADGDTLPHDAKDSLDKLITPLNIEDIQGTPLLVIKEEVIYEPDSTWQQNVQGSDQQYFQQAVGSSNGIKVEESETHPEDGVLKSESDYEKVFVQPSGSRCKNEPSELDEISTELEMMANRNHDVLSQTYQPFVCVLCSSYFKTAVELKNHMLVFHSSLR